MTQEAETAPMELLIVSCSGCDNVFVASERRSTCPACGGEAVGPYLEYVMDGAGLHLKSDGLLGELAMASADAAVKATLQVEEEGPAAEEEAVAPAEALAPEPAPPAQGESLTETFSKGAKAKGFINRGEAVRRLVDIGYSQEVAEAKVIEWDKEEELGGEEGVDDVEVFLEAVKSYLGGADALEEDIREWLEVRLGVEPEAAATAVGRLTAVRDLLRELAPPWAEAQVEVEAEEPPAEAPPPAVVEGEGEIPGAPEIDQVEGD